VHLLFLFISFNSCLQAIILLLTDGCIFFVTTVGHTYLCSGDWVRGGQGALWPMNIQLELNIESALHCCIFNFCFTEMKLYEERACLFNFLDSKIGNAEPAFSIFKIWCSDIMLWNAELLAGWFWGSRKGWVWIFHSLASESKIRVETVCWHKQVLQSKQLKPLFQCRKNPELMLIYY